MSRNDLLLFNDDFDFFAPLFTDSFFDRNFYNGTLKTDIIENEADYELIMNVPGLEKDNIKIEMENNYLTISVSNEVKEKKERHYIKEERKSLNASRSFYVGSIDESLIKAKLEKGVLKVIVPKEKEEIITKKQISIE